MSDDLKVAVIGGISGAIGSHTAKRLKESGWVVYGFGPSEEHLEAFRAECPGISTFKADARKSDEVKAIIQKIHGEARRIDAYVHSVGSVYLKPLHLTTDEDWDATLDINLNSAFYASRACVEFMQKQGSGSIVLISSVATRTGIPNHEAIAAAKGGINGLVCSAAATYAHRGIRVNAIAPGLVESKITKQLVSNKQSREISEKMHPLGRIGQPNDIANLIAWLVSEESGWVTGQVWSVDGGMASLMQRPKA